MYIAPGLLYLHLPRTAGTFVTNVLDRPGIGSRNVQGLAVHDGVRKIPEDLVRDRLVFGTVRDPWSWYVSLFCSYKHHKTGILTGPLAELCGNQATFTQALATMTKPVGQARMVAPKLPGHPEGIQGLGRTMGTAGIGLWSWYVVTTFCKEEVETLEGLSGQIHEGADLPWSVQVLVDAASVEDGLDRVLEAWAGPKSEETRAFLRIAPPINETAPQWCWKGVRPSGRPDPRWWTPEMIQTVEEVDGPLMRRFGFDRPVGARPSVHAFG